MKIITMIVDKLPRNCGDCEIRNDCYCPILNSGNGVKWIDIRHHQRNTYCPMQEQKKFDPETYFR